MNSDKCSVNAVTSLTNLGSPNILEVFLCWLEQMSRSVSWKGCGTPYAWWSRFAPGTFHGLHSYAAKWWRACWTEYVTVTWPPTVFWPHTFQVWCSHPYLLCDSQEMLSVLCLLPYLGCISLLLLSKSLSLDMRARKFGIRTDAHPAWYPHMNTFQKEPCNPQKPELCEEGARIVRTAQSLLTAGARGRRIPRAAREAGLWEGSCLWTCLCALATTEVSFKSSWFSLSYTAAILN